MQQKKTSRWCRAEGCEQVGLHEAHGALDTVEKEPKSHSKNVVWKRPSPRALDHCIAKAVSKTYPRHYDALLQVVVNDYGACNTRTVQRRLRTLVERGHVLRIALGSNLWAYLRPGSKLVNDIDLMREQCYAAMPNSRPSL